MDTPEQAKPSTEEQMSRPKLFERFRAKFSKPTPNPKPSPDNTVIKERIDEIHELLQDEKAPTPTWADKQVTTEAINLRSLPVDWQALSSIGRTINEIKDDHLQRQDFADIKPPPDVNLALPMVASVIVHHRNEEIPITLPTETQVKAMKPWLVTVERLLDRFSPNAARQFGKYVEKRGARAVTEIGERVVSIADDIGKIENPRQQFLHELTSMYRHLVQRETETGFWGEENERNIEDKIYRLLHTLKERNVYKSWPEETPRWLNERDFPLLIRLLPKFNIPPLTFDAGIASTAGAELTM